jgi:hypothetical protein
VRTSLDCIPCIFRQALEAVRRISSDPLLHELFLREVLQWARACLQNHGCYE